MLSVRFSENLQSQLADYCARAGVTKSTVLQQAVSDFLSRRNVGESSASGKSAPNRPGKVYEAFARAGLIGAIAAEPAGTKGARPGANKETVRKTVRAALARKARR